MKTKHFNQKDIDHLMLHSPLYPLSRLARATRVLKVAVPLGEEHAEILAQYPDTRAEPLAFFYMCLLSLGALDARLVSDLCDGNTWRGVVWAGWLAILRPHRDYLPILTAVDLDAMPHNRWVVELAVATIKGEQPHDDLHEIAALAARCRALLDAMSPQHTPMRPAPTPEELLVMGVERARVKQCYKEHGAEAALAMTRETLFHEHAMEHDAWLATL